jgi:PAS domain S-box-containing protein
LFWEGQTAVLERVAAGDPLREILEDIVTLIERQAEEMLCSLLLVDDDQARVRHGAAPSLPVEYAKHLDGQRIGPSAGSCGTAAYRRERVIVEDIASHPYWADYRHLALPFGLAACWSSPIFSPEREVLGTFAMYYRLPRGPRAEEIAWVDAATHLAAVAIGSQRAATSLRRSEARAQHLARLYAMSNAINEVMVRERDAAGLYDAACRIAIDHGMARLAWVGRVEDNQRIAVVARAGMGHEYVTAIHLDLGDERMNHGPAAQAVQSGAPAICNDIANDPDFYWKEMAAAHRLGSCAIFPMKLGARTAGILAIYAEQPRAFAEEETRIFATLANDIAFAVESARTEAALHQSEERLRAIIEHTPDVPIQWYDDAGRLLFYNQASRHVFGWSEQGALGKSLLELGFWNSAEEARFGERRAQAAAGQHVAPTQFSFQRSDGSDGFLLSTVFEIPVSDRQRCYVCMDVDLTEHHRMEAAVRAGETLRALIYDCVADMVFYLVVEDGGRYRFLSVNRAFLSATGLAEHEVVGRLVDEVIPPASLTLVQVKYAEAVSTLRKVVWEEVSRYPAGVKYGEVTVCPILDAGGRCAHLVGTVHDVTERREAELERRQIEAQLHEAHRLRALGTLAGGIAHDFNNILTAIHGNLDMSLADLDEQHPVREGLLEVKQAAERATDMVRQILTFGRQSEPRRELLDLQPVIREALKLLAPTVKGGVRWRTSFRVGAPRISADATQIHQVVMNLASNAAYAIGDDDGLVEVELAGCSLAAAELNGAPELAAGSYVRLTVRDDGCGMDERTLRRIFEPFFTTKPAGEGTGLGMSVVHGIVKSHDGALTVESEIGRGTTFNLYFPAADPARRGATRNASAPRRGQGVLFVDDDEALVVLARRAFSRLGHEISAHSSSREALLDYASHPTQFDVVVTDIRMPELDGPSLVRELRRLDPKVKIVLTSGYLSEDDVRIANDLGVDQLLEKTQSFDDLARLVVSLVR